MTLPAPRRGFETVQSSRQTNPDHQFQRNPAFGERFRVGAGRTR
jgi:hypothetical protein